MEQILLANMFLHYPEMVYKKKLNARKPIFQNYCTLELRAAISTTSVSPLPGIARRVDILTYLEVELEWILK